MSDVFRRTIIRAAVAVSFFSLITMPAIVAGQGLKDAFGGTKSPLNTVANQAGVKDVDSVGTVSGRIINTALTLVGLIFLLLMVYGGYLWMTARGDEGQVEKAQSIIRNAIIGIVLVIAAYAITYFITNKLEKGA